MVIESQRRLVPEGGSREIPGSFRPGSIILGNGTRQTEFAGILDAGVRFDPQSRQYIPAEIPTEKPAAEFSTRRQKGRRRLKWQLRQRE